MRDIKFRAWDGKKMYFPIEWSDKGVLYPNEYIHDNCPNEGDLALLYNIGRGVVEMLQWTGLVDKNGVEIYEGDIIKLYGLPNAHFQVVFKNQYMGGWVLMHKKNEVSLGERDKNELKVVGNIYENLELLEK